MQFLGRMTIACLIIKENVELFQNGYAFLRSQEPMYEREGRWLKVLMFGILVMMKLFYILIVVMVIQIYPGDKII